MKIMHVMAGAREGGAENIFLESLVALSQTPVEQYAVIRANNALRMETLKAHDIAFATASFSKLFKASTRRTLDAAIERFDPDIVQYWMGRAGIFARRGRAKTVGWYGGYYKLSRFKVCDFHIALTRDIARHIVKQGAPESHVTVIHTYAGFAEQPPAPRAALGTPDGVPLLLALARLHPKKGLDVLLKAVARLPGIYLWIAGEGPLEHELKQLAASLRVDDRVRFLGWRNDRGAILKAADICVFPSRYEPFGTVMVDAWAAGTPLIAAAAQGPSAYVQHEENGLLVAIDDVGGFADAIARLIADDMLRAHIVAGGSATYDANFSKQAFIDRSLNFYRRILA